jgi:hypothetical protein
MCSSYYEFHVNEELAIRYDHDEATLLTRWISGKSTSDIYQIIYADGVGQDNSV